MNYPHALLLIALFLALTPYSKAQENDSLAIQLQSLRVRVDSLESVVKQAQNNMFTSSDVENMFRSIDGNHQEFTDEDRRSKRRILDSLFATAISQQGKLTLSGQLMNVFFWNGRVDDESIHPMVGTLDLFAISSLTQNSLIFLNIQTVGGGGPGVAYPSYSGYHAGAGSTATNGFDYLHIQEAWAEYRLNPLTLTAGKIDLTNYFDPNSIANDEYTQFLASAFVNNPASPIPGNAPGLVINFDFLKDFTLLYGLSSTHSIGENLLNNMFNILQLGKSFMINKNEAGALRVFGYHTADGASGYGYGVTGDIKLIQRLYLYGRYGKNQPQVSQAFGVAESVSGGLQLRNYPIWDLLNLSGGVAVSRSTGVSGETKAQEQALETYLELKVGDSFFVSPHYQWIGNRMGTGDDLSLVAVRVRVAF